MFWTPVTNEDIWEHYRSHSTGVPPSITTTLNDFVFAICTHELNHYNTIDDAVTIIVNGLATCENYRFMTDDKAIAYGEKAKKEGNRVWHAAWAHTLEFDGFGVNPQTGNTWRYDSLLDPHCYPFTEPFNRPLPY